MSAADQFRFLANECVEAQVVAHLRESGVKIDPTLDFIHSGSYDPEVLDLGRALRRPVITYDRNAFDFEALDDEESPGLIIVRCETIDFEFLADLIVRGLNRLDPAQVPGSVIVVEPTRIRLRDSDGESATFDLT